MTNLLNTVEEVIELKSDLEVRTHSLNMIKQLKDGNFEGWNKFTDYPSIKVFYKKEEAHSLYTFYMEKLIKAPVFNVVSVLAEA